MARIKNSIDASTTVGKKKEEKQRLAPTPVTSTVLQVSGSIAWQITAEDSIIN
jgi:hypothetical protein